MTGLLNKLLLMKRYYPFDERAERCWQNSPILRQLLNPNWLATQAQNQLLWQQQPKTHPLFALVCFNSPIISALETALEQSSQETRQKIKRHLKRFVRTRSDLWGFLSEIFVMLRLTSRGIRFDYRPGEEGADFVLLDMNNLEIEITSIQADRVDKKDIANTWWRIGLETFESDLHLELVRTKPAKDLSDDDWIAGFESFQDYIHRKKDSQVGEKILLLNRSQHELAQLKVRGINQDSQKATVVFVGSHDGYFLDMSEETQNFFQNLFQRIYDKAKQISGSGVICLDVTHWKWDQELVRAIPGSWEFLTSLIQEELSQNDYDSIAGFVMFQGDYDKKNIRMLEVIRNHNSNLAQHNPNLFRKALDIFAP